MPLNQIIKNSSFLFASDIVSKVVNVVFLAFLSRYLTPEETGIYITVITFFSIGIALSDPGISQVIIRDISRNPEENLQRYNQSIILCTILWVSLWGFITASGYFMGYSSQVVWLLAMGGLYIGVQSWGQMTSGYIQAKQEMKIVAIGNAQVTIMFGLLGIWGLYLGIGLNVLIILLVIQGTAYWIYFMKKAMPLGLPLDKRNWNLYGIRGLIREVLPIAALATSGILLNRLDVIMLSKIKGMEDTAAYGLAVRFIDNLAMISNSVGMALFPYLSSQWEKSREEIGTTLRKSFQFYIIMGLGAALIVNLFASEIITIFYGYNFVGSSYVLNILIWSFLFSMMGAPYTLLILMERDKVTGFIGRAVFVVCMNIGLNLLLIPHFGMIGAGVSTLICSVVLFYFKLDYVRGYFPVKIKLLGSYTR
jgi:O-antigen/teichoic acid export membrane protein